MSPVLPLLGAALFVLSRRGRAERSEEDSAETVRERLLQQAQRDTKRLADLQSLKEVRRSGRKPAKAPDKRTRLARRPSQPAPSAPREDTTAQSAVEAATAAAEAEAAQRRGKAPTPASPPAAARAATAPAPKPRLVATPEIRTVRPAPERTLPQGYDPAAARREARNVARHIYNAGGGYPRFKAAPRAWAERARGQYARSVVKGWQRLAGLTPDGVYGPATHNALKYYGADAAPPSLFRRRADGTYWNDEDPRAVYVPPEER